MSYSLKSRLRSGLRLITLLALMAGTAAAQPSPVIRVDVNLVRVVATVKNSAGELVKALSKDDFEISDNGVKQEIAVFERQTEQPLSVVLMVDTSGSTGKDIKFETDSATRFLRALLSEGNTRDSAAIYSFNFDITLQQDFTRNLRALESAFKQFHSEGATALYDAIRYGALALEPREGRKVIVVVTDGANTMPNSIDYRQALEAAQMADAVIYPVVVIPITNDAGRSLGGEHVLSLMAQGTGGKTFAAALGEELDQAFADIISELRTQYMLAYYPRGVPPTTKRFHNLAVNVKRPELQVSARNGYYGEIEERKSDPDARISITPERPAPPPPPDRKKRTDK